METTTSLDQIRGAIRDVPDFPKPGIVFKDITPVLQDSQLFNGAVDAMLDQLAQSGVKYDKIAAIESRGFLFGSAMAYRTGRGLVLLRKPKKLPYKTAKVEYDLEYGTDALEVHVDAFQRNDRVLVVDDILATGGTAQAAGQLVREVGAHLSGYCFFSSLGFLDGKKRLTDSPIYSLFDL